MNKSELIDEIAEKNGVSKAEAKKQLENVLNGIKSGVSSRGEVALVGFGKFSKVTRAARTGRNPQTGQPLHIAAKTVVKFKVASNF